MIIVGILVSLALLGLITRFALSKKSDKLVRRAAIIALGVIGLVIVVCLFMIVTGPKDVEAEPVFAGLPLAEPVQVTDPKMVYALIFGVIMLLFLGLIIFLSTRDKKSKR